MVQDFKSDINTKCKSEVYQSDGITFTFRDYCGKGLLVMMPGLRCGGLYLGGSAGGEVFTQVLPGIAVREECDDEPNEQQQREQDGHDQVLHLVTQVHEFR